MHTRTRTHANRWLCMQTSTAWNIGRQGASYPVILAGAACQPGQFGPSPALSRHCGTRLATAFQFWPVGLLLCHLARLEANVIHRQIVCGPFQGRQGNGGERRRTGFACLLGLGPKDSAWTVRTENGRLTSERESVCMCVHVCACVCMGVHGCACVRARARVPIGESGCGVSGC